MERPKGSLREGPRVTREVRAAHSWGWTARTLAPRAGIWFDAVMPFINSEECSHSGAHEEVMGGQRTGEYVCDRCGESWMSRQALERAQDDYESRRGTAGGKDATERAGTVQPKTSP